MTDQEIIDRTVAYVKEQLAQAEGGHDWWHIQRVWQLSRTILAQEPAQPLVVQLGALLHDIADAKFHGGDETLGPQCASAFLQSLGVSSEVIDQVVFIIANISYRGGHHETAVKTPELQVVQDADRLDAIGAIGIARAFSYGGYKGRPFYDPAIPPDMHMTKEQYQAAAAPTINHFYEKLLLLKDRMNTATGRRLAQHRHDYMVQFLEEFYAEFDGRL